MFPTPVGMNRYRRNYQVNAVNVPQTRGDEPAESCNPGTRANMFPTPVGMNRWLKAQRAKGLNVPHTRGDEPYAYMEFDDVV